MRLVPSLAVALLVGCSGKEPESEAYVGLLVDDADREALLARVDEAPFDGIYADLVHTAEEELREQEGSAWDHGVHGHNADVAQSAAFLAWLHEDESWADLARAASAVRFASARARSASAFFFAAIRARSASASALRSASRALRASAS